MKTLLMIILAVIILFIGYKFFTKNKMTETPLVEKNQNTQKEEPKQRPEMEGVQMNIKTDHSFIKWEAQKVLIRTNDHYGKVLFKEGFVIEKDGILQGGEFVVDVNTINTEDLEGSLKDKLDNHLKSEDFFDASNFPASKLIINSVSEKEAGRLLVKADLTIKGITNPIEFEATVEKKDNNKYYKAQFEIDRTLWNIQFGSGKFFDNLGDNVIDDKIKFSIEIVVG